MAKKPVDAEEPKSKRGKVQACFKKEGAEAAEALGTELGVGPGRIKRWIRGWSATTTPSTPAKIAPTPAAAVSALRPPKPNQVKVSFIPYATATLLEKGADQSRIKWPNGNVNTVPNDWVSAA